MSIYFSGTFTRSGGVVAAIGKELKSVNLKAVKRVTFSFDPFSENARTPREFLHYLSSPKIISTNPKCAFKTEILCNRLPSKVVFSLIPNAQEQLKAKEVQFLADNLSVLELFQLLNKHISSLAPKEEEATAILQTKSAKKLGSAVQRKKK